MDAESYTAKEVICAKKAALRGNLIGACVCFAGAVFSIGISIYTYPAPPCIPDAPDWIPSALATLVAIILIGCSMMGWHFVARDRKLLMHLRVMTLQGGTLKQPGVWPPPPSEPKEE